MQIEDIANEVRSVGGWKTYQVRVLRDAVGMTRAKVNVVQRISDALREAGCGHVPAKLPMNQDAWVAVYSGQSAEYIVKSVFEQPEQWAQFGNFLFKDGPMRAAVQAVDDWFENNKQPDDRA